MNQTQHLGLNERADGTKVDRLDDQRRCAVYGGDIVGNKPRPGDHPKRFHYMPGNATSYHLVLCALPSEDTSPTRGGPLYSTGEHFDVLLSWINGPDGGCSFMFKSTSYVAASYLEEKMFGFRLDCKLQQPGSDAWAMLMFLHDFGYKVEAPL